MNTTSVMKKARWDVLGTEPTKFWVISLSNSDLKACPKHKRAYSAFKTSSTFDCCISGANGWVTTYSRLLKRAFEQRGCISWWEFVIAGFTHINAHLRGTFSNQSFISWLVVVQSNFYSFINAILALKAYFKALEAVVCCCAHKRKFPHPRISGPLGLSGWWWRSEGGSDCWTKRDTSLSLSCFDRRGCSGRTFSFNACIHSRRAWESRNMNTDWRPRAKGGPATGWFRPMRTALALWVQLRRRFQWIVWFFIIHKLDLKISVWFTYIGH